MKTFKQRIKECKSKSVEKFIKEVKERGFVYHTQEIKLSSTISITIIEKIPYQD